MVRPSQDAINTFISITGASESVAIQMLEEHDGDLNRAVDAHFNDGDRTNASTNTLTMPQNDYMDTDNVIDVDSPVHPRSLLSAAAPSLNPFSLLNTTFDHIFDGRPSEHTSRMPHVSHPRERRQIPIEFKDGDNQLSSSHGPVIEEITDSIPTHGPEIRGSVIIDDEDDDIPGAPAHESNHTQSDDIEEEMLRAAIEASKREAEASSKQQFDVSNGDYAPSIMEDDISRAVSLSLKASEQEKMHEMGNHGGEPSDSVDIDLGDVGIGPFPSGRQGFVAVNPRVSGKSVLEGGSTSVTEEAEDVDVQPLVRNRPRRSASAHVVHSPPLSPRDNQRDDHQLNGETFPMEWGGISSEEHDEAVMLEAAMFGGVPDGVPYNFRYPPVSERVPPRPPSPSLTAQRLLREQQDDEYQAALQADREKTERLRLEEAAAREAAVAEEKHQREEARRKLREEEESERILAAKQASLPSEPSSDDENAVTLLVRMPDGSRYGRRFSKSDKLQYLFDYIDIGRAVKPGTYRLVRPYPRRTFSIEESASTLSELGLINKQEALFLELM